MVGFSAVTSPFVPFLILFEVSVSVKGDPYPIALPIVAITLYNNDIQYSINALRGSRICRINTRRYLSC